MAEGETLGGGILQAKSNSQLVAEERAKLEAEKEAQKRPELTGLAGHVKSCFEAAERFRSIEISSRLIDCKRRRDGKYSPEKLAQIKERGGPDSYLNLTDTKCDAAEAWIEDVFTKEVDSPWDLEPTPIPDLPEDVQSEVVQRVVETVRMAIDQQGQQFSGPDIVALTDQVREGRLKELRDEAKKRVAKMSVKIEDQLVEGNYDRAFDEFIHNLCMYPIGIMKGPVIESHKRMKWGDNGIEIAEELVPTFYSVDPNDFYPGPNSKSVNDSYVCELMHLDRADLAQMREAPGYSAKAIDAVLASKSNYGDALLSASGQAEHSDQQGRDTSFNGGLPSGSVAAVEFWGSVQGRMLLDWGMKPDRVKNPLDFYEVTAILVGDHVVKAILNPDPLGRRPYFKTSYIRESGQMWGKSVPEKMKDEQDNANAAIRNLISNLALASGPQVEIDLDALDPAVNPLDVYPGKVWQVHKNKSQGKDVVRWFQPEIRSEQLLAVERFFEDKCDDRTQIPRYAYGNDDVQGAGKTASGLSMLFGAAAKGIKRTIKNIDRDVIRPLIEHLYRWNLVNLDDEEFGDTKGDCRVVPRGAIASLIREQTKQKRLEFLTLTNNAIDMEIIGIVGRAAVLRKVAEELDLDVSEIVPDTEDLIARLREKQALALAQGQQPIEGEGGGQTAPDQA